MRVDNLVMPNQLAESVAEELHGLITASSLKSPMMVWLSICGLLYDKDGKEFPLASSAIGLVCWRVVRLNLAMSNESWGFRLYLHQHLLLDLASKGSLDASAEETPY